MINNFDTIDKFLNFEDGYFYKFEALVRNTDGENSLFEKGYSNTNKNILIKNWYVDNKEYYERSKKEMIELCNMTGARLYVTLDRKEKKKLLIQMFNTVSKILTNYICGDIPSLKSITKLLASCSSVIETSEHKSRTIMFDVDTKNEDILEIVKLYILENNETPYCLETKKGYHVFCYKKFKTENWVEVMTERYFNDIKFEDIIAENNYKSSFKARLSNVVSMKPNELGLVYLP